MPELELSHPTIPHVTTSLAFDVETETFIFCEEQLHRDKIEDLPDNVRMARRCLPAMKTVNKNLKFTTESPVSV